MISNLPDNNLNLISHFDNAVFFCMDSSSNRVPVSIVNKVALLKDDILEFNSTHLPVMEQGWNVFAAELHFYKKGLPFNMKVHGTAWFVNKDELTVQFRVLHVENFGQPLAKQYSFQETLVDFFSTTGTFFRRMLVTGF